MTFLSLFFSGQAEEERYKESSSVLPTMLDISSVLTEAAAAMVDDSFSTCFRSLPPDPWNWNLYLFPLWWVAELTAVLYMHILMLKPLLLYMHLSH